MHDLGLGGPVVDEVHPDAKHKGPCYDGVYGCHLCWNEANDGKGEVSSCDGCRANNVHTQIVRGVDEPVLYAACDGCQKRRTAYIAELERELDDERVDFDWRDD